MAQPVPAHEEMAFKTRIEFRYIGKGKVPITDLRDITTGKAVYGADVTLPGMKVAVIARPPVVGGTAASYDDSAALAIDGVEAVRRVAATQAHPSASPRSAGSPSSPRTHGRRNAGRDALEIEWEAGRQRQLQLRELHAGDAGDGGTAGQDRARSGRLGQPPYRRPRAPSTRTYTQNHMAHIPMEPPAALANFADGKLEIWAPVQSPYRRAHDAASAVGLDPEDVTVHVTLLGGGFGRKSKCDFVTEAAAPAPGRGRAGARPVDARGRRAAFASYHTTSVERIEVTLDADGKVTGWHHRSVAPTILSTFAADPGLAMPLEERHGT